MARTGKISGETGIVELAEDAAFFKSILLYGITGSPFHFLCVQVELSSAKNV